MACGQNLCRNKEFIIANKNNFYVYDESNCQDYKYRCHVRADDSSIHRFIFYLSVSQSQQKIAVSFGVIGIKEI